jgi:hypothetical protein
LKSRNDDFVNRLKRFLADHQITDYHFEENHRKRSVVVTRAGKTVRVRFPKSSANFRMPYVGVMRLRRALGLNGGAR